MLNKIRSAVGLFLICGASAACMDESGRLAYTNRWGPNPAIQPATFNSTAQNQAIVIAYLGRAAGYLAEDGTQLRTMNAAAWADLAQWGFNVGRQDCEIYMDTLFRLNREKGRNDNVLAAAATAVAGMVTATTTAQKPLSILAAVFGLSIAVNDAIYQSYLFTQAPGLVAKKVSDLQEVFRNSVLTGDIQINSAATAYYAIQSYYRICLPHSIEGVMLQAIADTKPATPPAAPGAPAVAAAPPAAAGAPRLGGGGGGNRALAMRSPVLR